MVLGKISKSTNNVVLTANTLKVAVGLELSGHEIELEDKLNE